jgi:hypothetical protein
MEGISASVYEEVVEKRSGPPNDSAVNQVKMIDLIRSAFREQRLQHRIGEDFRIEELLEAVEGVFPPACAYRLVIGVLRIA